MADLPESIAHLVEVTDEGLRFSTKTGSTEAVVGMGVGGVVLGLTLIIPSALLLIFSPGCCLFILIGLVLMVVMPLLGTTVKKEISVDITPDGMRQNTLGGTSRTWGRFEGLTLTGNLKKRDAKLRADKVVIREWKALKSDAEKGWDLESVRWFAERVSEISGLPLNDSLPRQEDYLALEQKKADAAAQRRADKRAKFDAQIEARYPELHCIPGSEAKTRTLPEGEAYVMDKGQRSGRAKRTSTNEDQPLLVSEGRLIVGKQSQALEDFEVFFVWFETEAEQVDVLLGGDLKSGKRWKLARRDSMATGQVRGVADALNALISH